MMSSVENAVSKSFCYRIYAVNRKGIIVIKNLTQDNFFNRTAHEILADQKLLKGFSIQEIKQIKSIAEDN